LHSAKWTASLISRFLWQRASAQLSQWQQAGQQGLVIWDERSWEKPESLQLEDLGPTRSSKAARLTHIKPGYYSPPTGPIFVPGMQWLAVLLIGRLAQQGPPLLAAQRWWTNRGPHASFKRDEEGKLLVELAASWGRAVIHVFDQGFSSAFWLGLLLAYALRFVLRWRKDYQLLDAAGNRRLTWKIAQGKRGWSQRTVWDARHARWVIATVLVLQVAHPDHPDQPLWLVVCRSQGRSPWYLLTAEAIQTDEQAWHVVYAYVRRWQIELSWKYEKSELAFQSPRIYEGEAREKLLLLATLAYAFLLTLLNEGTELLRLWLLRYYAHRTGWHCRTAKLPLTRLRCALSRLWQDLPPNFASLGPPLKHIHVTEVI
jgi:Transposase DDE domain